MFSYSNNISVTPFQDVGISRKTSFLEIGCSYIPPDQCSNSRPPTCCERITGTEATTEGGAVLRASVALLLLFSLLTAFIMG